LSGKNNGPVGAAYPRRRRLKVKEKVKKKQTAFNLTLEAITALKETKKREGGTMSQLVEKAIMTLYKING
jgi:hypothetical protein